MKNLAGLEVSNLIFETIEKRVEVSPTEPYKEIDHSIKVEITDPVAEQDEYRTICGTCMAVDDTHKYLCKECRTLKTEQGASILC